LNEANQYGIDIRMNADVVSVEYNASAENNQARFQVTLRNQKKIPAHYLCIASGGFPKKSQYEWIEKLKHSIEYPVPSLFTFNIPNNKITSLMGIVVQYANVKIIGSKLQQSGPVLITHWGLSGPAVLKLSAWGARELADCNYEFDVAVNWLPDFNEHTLKEKFQLLRFEIASQKIYNRNPFGLPARLWEYLLQLSEIKEEIRWADLPAKEQNKLIKFLSAHSFSIKGKTTFKEEFVTAGGVHLTEINPNTMMSRLTPGLFFAGEILNIDGVTGGFNFQNAWTTGWIAANNITTDFVD
jgi:predicted Rossmann fold flavoprotein